MTKRGKLFKEVQEQLKLFEDLQNDKTLAALASVLIRDCNKCPFVAECRIKQDDCARTLCRQLQLRGTNMQIPEYILALFQLKAEYLHKLKLIDEKINKWIKTQQGE